MKLQVLISCMRQKDFSIIERSNVQTDAIIVNQCDDDKIEEFDFINKKGETCHVKFISTIERGLSRSRNMAIRNATADICLICDDDEILEDDYNAIICDAFKTNEKYEVLAFNVKNPKIKFPKDEFEISFFKTGKITSWQISFRRTKRILSVPFNVKMGSGTENGGGEENKFLVDCLSKGVKIKYIPKMIGAALQENSQWFYGYTKKFHQDRGWVSRQIYGRFWGFIYICYSASLRMSKIDKEHNVFRIFLWMLTGYFKRR